MSLEVFCGCQSSGKTQANISISTKYVDVLKCKGLFINSSIDTRDNERVISSNSSSYNGISERFIKIKVFKLMDVINEVNLNDYPIISIDEVQFYPDLIEFVKTCLNMDKHIICSGLDTDWKGNDIGYTCKLLSLSTHFKKLTAKCSWCKNELNSTNIRNIPDACRTGKLINTNNIIIEAGNDELYVPLCLKHHREHLINIHKLDPDTLEPLL
jgi:thymidine kinase